MRARRELWSAASVVEPHSEVSGHCDQILQTLRQGAEPFGDDQGVGWTRMVHLEPLDNEVEILQILAKLIHAAIIAPTVPNACFAS